MSAFVESIATVPWLWLGILGAATVLAYQKWFGSKLDIPHIGPKPTLLGNTSQGEFYQRSVEMVNEGYAKYKDSLYYIWTTNMDRLMIPAKYMSDFNQVPRSHLKLTATVRYSGKYTGMDIADEGMLGYDVCAGPLSQNIGRLAQPVYDEIVHAHQGKVSEAKDVNGVYTVPMYYTILEVVTASTARMFVGPDLCRDPEWLSTVSGYTGDIGAVVSDLRKHYKFLHPIIAPRLESYKQLQRRFGKICEILLPIFEQRRKTDSMEHADMIQWLIDTAKGPDTDSTRLAKRMPFLNMAAIHSTAHTTVNVILDLCQHPEYIQPIREEIVEAIKAHGIIKASTLASLKKLDSFMKESQRLSPMDLMLFNRQVTKPVTLSNNITIPKNTFISMPIYPMCRDPERYPDPETFDGYRFYKLRQIKEEARYQFAASDRDGPAWGFGKFACPGRFWAAAQVKLVVMALLVQYDIAYPEGQTDRPGDVILGEKRTPDRTQQMVLKRLDPALSL
ncbi:cytochrome P450 [Aspergillus campestris IBT 28561]|uniref:Cytochrome P450 n=1 Tax=Aspergillus campestris (strain IBT 28561) TaxID=1392248 RepID=A0A2I1CVF2_ASPC2|nr:cytochrome P450 [Aspergillus campestris IBT 28561]PKY01598.1 cytochrome P450 [Aspergillus campestris IBT 28561]